MSQHTTLASGEKVARKNPSISISGPLFDRFAAKCRDEQRVLGHTVDALVNAALDQLEASS